MVLEKKVLKYNALPCGGKESTLHVCMCACVLEQWPHFKIYPSLCNALTQYAMHMEERACVCVLRPCTEAAPGIETFRVCMWV